MLKLVYEIAVQPMYGITANVYVRVFPTRSLQQILLRILRWLFIEYNARDRRHPQTIVNYHLNEIL